LSIPVLGWLFEPLREACNEPRSSRSTLIGCYNPEGTLALKLIDAKALKLPWAVARFF